MVEIVGEDTQKKRKVTCWNCLSILQYTLFDTSLKTCKDYGGGIDSFRILICPKCNSMLDVPL